MKTITALLLLAALPAFAADPPADAPVLEDLDAPGQSIILDEGSPTPYRGVLLDEQEDRRRERSRVACKAELAKGQESAWLSKPLLVTVIVGAVVLGAAAGAGVTAYALKKSP